MSDKEDKDMIAKKATQNEKELRKEMIRKASKQMFNKYDETFKKLSKN